jgi:hypothetical protein
MTKRSQKTKSVRCPNAADSAKALYPVLAELFELESYNRIFAIFFAIAAKENVLLKKPVTRLRLQLSHA